MTHPSRPLVLTSLVALVIGLMTWPRLPVVVAAPAQARTMAVTIDDLPYVNLARGPYLASAERVTTAILEALRKHGAPAVAFVNEGQFEHVPDKAALRR